MSAPKRILVVEDEIMIATYIEDTLAELGHVVVKASTNLEARNIVASGNVDLAIVDYHLRDGPSSDLAAALNRLGVPFVICSGSTGVAELDEIFGDTVVLAKPFTTEGLIAAVSKLDQAEADHA